MLASNFWSHTSPRLLRWVRLLLLVLLAATFALRLHELTRQNIWWDEARNIDVALRPFTQIAAAPELDIQPPFYYWLLHGWARVSGATLREEPAQLAYLTRFLSVAAGLISIALLYPLGARIFSPLAALFATTLAALSPFWLAESQESRMYTVGFALLTGAALALLWGIGEWGPKAGTPWAPESGNWGSPGIAEGMGPRTRLALPFGLPIFLPGRFASAISFVLFTLLSVLAILTHYNALFVLAAWYGWWLLYTLAQRERWPQLRILLLCGLATALLLTPILPLALRQIPTYANPNLTIPTIGEYLNQNWRAYLGGYAFDPTLLGGYGTVWLWTVLAMMLLGLLGIVFHTVRLRRAGPGPLAPCPLPLAPFLLFWAIGGLALYYVAVLDRGTFNVRYSSLITPALYLLLGGALAAWGIRWRPLAWATLAVVVAGMLPALRADLYDVRFNREDIAGVTGWLRSVAGAEDLVLVDQKYPFGFYYKRYAMDPAQTPVGPEPAPARYLFVDINTVDQRLNEWAGQARQIFWVQWFESDTDPRHAVHFLLDKAGRQAGSQSFQGYSIDWWALDPPNRFALAPALTPAVYRFPPVVETVAISLPSAPVERDKGVPVVIRWRRIADTMGRPAQRAYKARVAIYDANEARLAQSDERLLNDRHLMPVEWDPEDEPLNVYFLPLPAEITAGEYAVRLLVYDADTLEPLTLIDQAGNPAGVEATLGMVKIIED